MSSNLKASESGTIPLLCSSVQVFNNAGQWLRLPMWTHTCTDWQQCTAHLQTPSYLLQVTKARGLKSKNVDSENGAHKKKINWLEERKAFFWHGRLLTIRTSTGYSYSTANDRGLALNQRWCQSVIQTETLVAWCPFCSSAEVAIYEWPSHLQESTKAGEYRAERQDWHSPGTFKPAWTLLNPTWRCCEMFFYFYFYHLALGLSSCVNTVFVPVGSLHLVWDLHAVTEEQTGNLQGHLATICSINPP